MKVVICDDHELFRAGLRDALGSLPSEAGELTLLESGDAPAALALVAEHDDVALVLLDLELPGMDGMQALARLREGHPTVSVAVVSAEQGGRAIRAALDGGASGFIPKTSKKSVLLSALQIILDGGIYVPPEALERSSRRSGAPTLSDRQQEVLELLVKGLTNKEIAGVLGISAATVKVHVAAVLDALEVTNRTEAATVAQELGVLGDDSA